jgi:hypothetical protein
MIIFPARKGDPPPRSTDQTLQICRESLSQFCMPMGNQTQVLETVSASEILQNSTQTFA